MLFLLLILFHKQSNPFWVLHQEQKCTLADAAWNNLLDVEGVETLEAGKIWIPRYFYGTCFTKSK